MTNIKVAVLSPAVGTGLGIGHLRRCETLGDWLQSRGWAVFSSPLRIDGDSVSLEGDGFPEVTGETTSQALWIIDASVTSSMHVGQHVQDLLKGNEGLWRVCLIDNQSPTALAPHLFPTIQPYLIVIPHGAPGRRSKGRDRIGLGYAVFPNALYQVAGMRSDAEPAIAERLLVTTGGIDSAGMSAFFVQCLELVDHPRLRVSVTIGPDFSSSNIQSVESRCRKSRHSWTLVREAPSLVQYAAETDLALTAGGLTKVELCAMGVPAVIIDEARDHAGDSILLNELGAAHWLGLFADLNETECVDAISSLIHDGDRRQAMSKAGRAVFNRAYAETTISELEEAIQ